MAGAIRSRPCQAPCFDELAHLCIPTELYCLKHWVRGTCWCTLLGGELVGGGGGF